ncbi:MAG: nucleotidyltransferase domain-containing protein [bacterium]|nr:nucleotidyltransferase domain-containing protein [bacterium]
MDKNQVLEIIARFRKVIELKGIKVDRLILFGSYVTGTAREGSDIDLVVISEDFADKNYWERIEILSDAIYEIFEPIEAVAMTPTEWNNEKSMIVNFAKSGELVIG